MQDVMSLQNKLTQSLRLFMAVVMAKYTEETRCLCRRFYNKNSASKKPVGVKNQNACLTRINLNILDVFNCYVRSPPSTSGVMYTAIARSCSQQYDS